MFLIHLRPIFLLHKNYSTDMQNKSVIWDSTDKYDGVFDLMC